MNIPEMRAAIARTGKRRKDLAKTMKLTERGLQNKLSGRSQFKCREISALARELGLGLDAVNLIFFDGEVK